MSNRTYFFEDFSSKDLNESVVGRKGMSLFKLKDIDVPVPPFFVVSPTVFDDLIFQAFGQEIENYLREKRAPDPVDVEKMLFKSDLTTEVEEELFKSYAKLSGFNDAWVAVRSSVVYPLNNKVLFSGIFTTEVNVRGFEDVVQAVKKIYSSVFKDCVVTYARRHNIDLSQLKMAVVVQKMVQAEVSGVTYTKDLITQDESKMSIESVFGLGDVIANAEITPDRYVLNKKDLSFEEKKVSPQEWMHIRMLNTKGQGGVERVNISSSWSHQQKLEDRFLKEIAKICLLIEDSFGRSQNIEWVWESGKVWVIQNKFVYIPQIPKIDEQKYSNVLLNPVLEVVRQKKEEEIKQEQEDIVCEDKVCEVEKKEKAKKERKDLDEKIAKLSGKFEELARKKIIQEQKKIQKIKEEVSKEKERMSKSFVKDGLKIKNFKFFASGIGVSRGVKVGQILHVNSKNYKDLVVSKENILVLKEIFPGVENPVFLAGGVLMDLGGFASDISMLCREFSVPAVFGVKGISKLLNEGDFVKMDANSGALYIYEEEDKNDGEGDIDYEILTGMGDVKEKREKKVEIKEKSKIDVRADVLNVPEIHNTATQVYVSSKEMFGLEKYVLENVAGLAILDLEEMMLNEKRHPLVFGEEGKMVEYTNMLAKKIDAVADLFASSEVIVSLGNYRSKDFAELTKGKGYEKLGRTRGVLRYLQSPEFARIALKIVSKSRNVYKNKNVSLAFHSPLSGENMIAIKKKTLGAGLRRNSTFKIYAILENPSEILLAEDIASANIDGIIINTPALARQMQGLSLYDEKALYDLEINSLFRTLEDMYTKLKNTNTTLLGITENNEKLLKKFVELGFCGVVVDGDEFANAKKIISDKEAEIILSQSRF